MHDFTLLPSELQLIIADYRNNLAYKGYYSTHEAVLVTRRVELLERELAKVSK